MKRTRADDDASDGRLSRRNVLSLGVGTAGAVLGLSGLPGTAAAWKRFDADFRGCEEVRLVVHEHDLQFDPPAVARVVVASDGDLACRTVECTPTAATTMPDQYGEWPVVTYAADADETILGVIEYNYRDDRFSEPVCLLPNDNACATASDVPPLQEADCVQAGVDGYWRGEVRECWFDPLDGGAGSPGDGEDGEDDGEDDGEEDGAAEPGPQQHLTAPEPTDGEEFGAAVTRSTDGDVVLVGAPGATVDGVESGLVYVYRRENDEWTYSGEITPDDAGDGARFGESVDLDAAGDVALVGAPTGGDGGFAPLFTYDGETWTRSHRFTGQQWVDEHGGSTGRLGDDVALADDAQTAVVGAPYTTLGAIHRGLSLAFERDGDGWSAGTELDRPDLGDSQQFGSAVAVAAEGERAVACAPVPFPGTTNPEGYVGVYPRGGSWEPESFLRHDQGQAGDLLGSDGCCNAACDLVLAGDPRNVEGDVPPRPGRVLAFDRRNGDWTQEAILEAPDGQAEDGFGTAVDANEAGTRALVGAPGTITSPDDYDPAVYAFERRDGAWTAAGSVPVPETATGGSFGASVALGASGDAAFVCAPEATVDGVESGAVYVYAVDDADG